MLTSEQLAALPVRGGFRLRGLEMTRIETFTDAAFAFALTLLVISGDPPTTTADLKQALKDVPAFVSSAILLMVFWYSHNDWSRRFGLDDMRTVILSSALVLSVMVYVYPLRFVARGFFLFIALLTGLPVSSLIGPDGQPTRAAESVAEVNEYFIIYGIGYVVISAIMVLLYRHALSQREELSLNEFETVTTQGDVGAWLIMCLVGVLSVIVAAANPFIGAPGFVYMLLSFVMPVWGARVRRRLKTISENATPSSREQMTPVPTVTQG